MLSAWGMNMAIAEVNDDGSQSIFMILHFLHETQNKSNRLLSQVRNLPYLNTVYGFTVFPMPSFYTCFLHLRLSQSAGAAARRVARTVCQT